MLAGVVVAELRGLRQPLDDLDLRRLQLARALAHLRFEHLVLALDLQIEEPRLEQRADPEQDFVGVERLVDEVFGAARQRLASCLRRHVAGEHQDRQVGGLDDLVELVHHCEAVQVRHVKVEQDEIRPVLHVQRRRFARVVRAVERVKPARSQHATQDFHVAGLVVDDEDARVLEAALGHRRAHHWLLRAWTSAPR